jgi:hypothetical protein
MYQTAIVDFSAQFGGHDAADAVLPHFKALKEAAKEITLDAFPYPELAFILRVDGEISQYGFSGVGEPEVDKDGDYLAIDIGVTVEDRCDVPHVIRTSMMDSLQIIAAAINSRGIGDFDVETLRLPLNQLCDRYTDALL